ncbi:peptide/nickel transport system permease protein [Microlunatus soli]|uniref:Peptide/nickel transport system permease protein n=1 Tax=Microlunatus soli TaxID=630515 RepID=A0A1H1Z075_9ACTN|nr:peptide/nickel transport system permease protein [Microlunatus soli]
MHRWVLRRAVIAVLQVLVLLMLIFGLSVLLPGDAADVQSSDLTTSVQRETTRRLLGLDVSPVLRFASWLGRLLHGDLGISYAQGIPVSQVIGLPLAESALLAFLATVLLVPIGGLLGFLGGLRPGGLPDRLITTVAVLLDAIPEFVLAVLLVSWLAVGAGLVPATAIGVDLAGLITRPIYLVLPLLIITARTAAPVVRLVRAGVIDVMDRPYIRQAARLGVTRWSLLVRHVAPNALGPAIQDLARTGSGLLGGVLVVEAIFVLPGIATTTMDAISTRDQPVLMAVMLIIGSVSIMINTVVDLIGRRLVPAGELVG